MNDYELVKACRKGDKSAWEELYLRYKPRVLAMARRFFLCGGETEDLVQEGMCGLYSAVNGYKESDSDFSAYAYKCIHNRIVDAVKKNGNMKNSALNNYISVEVADRIVAEDSPEDELIKCEDKREFLQKVSKILSPYEFQVLVMYTEGITVSEMASSLGKTYKSLDNSLSRAKQKILKMISMEK